LILDGLEKAERNVLPTLNNLLENREMSLRWDCSDRSSRFRMSVLDLKRLWTSRSRNFFCIMRDKYGEYVDGSKGVNATYSTVQSPVSDADTG
jgi:hypothetical protein